MSDRQATRSVRRGVVWPVALALVTLGLGACGGSDSDSGGSSSSSSSPSVGSATTLPTATTIPPTATTTPPTTTAGGPTTTAGEPSSSACATFTEKADLPLKLCDKGKKVEEVQQGLADADYEIVVDGFFGVQTRTAVQQFQAANGLTVDGIVGPLTFGKLFPT